MPRCNGLHEQQAFVHYAKKENKRSSQQGKREKIQIDGFWHCSPNAKKKKRKKKKKGINITRYKNKRSESATW